MNIIWNNIDVVEISLKSKISKIRNNKKTVWKETVPFEVSVVPINNIIYYR